MSMDGADFVKAAPKLLAVEGEDPPNLQFKVREDLSLCRVFDVVCGRLYPSHRWLWSPSVPTTPTRRSEATCSWRPLKGKQPSGPITRRSGTFHFSFPPPPVHLSDLGVHPLFLLTHGWSVDTHTPTHNIFRDAGVDWVDLLSPPQLQREFPWLALGEREGGSGESVGVSDGLVCG